MAARNGNAALVQLQLPLRLPNLRDNRRFVRLLAAGRGIEADEVVDGQAGPASGEEEEEGCAGGGESW